MTVRKTPKRLSDSVFYWSVRRNRYFLKEWFAWGRRWMQPLFFPSEKGLLKLCYQRPASVCLTVKRVVFYPAVVVLFWTGKTLASCVPVFICLTVNLRKPWSFRKPLITLASWLLMKNAPLEKPVFFESASPSFLNKLNTNKQISANVRLQI